LDPILVQPSPAGVKLLCGQFAFNASAVLTGDDDGSVTVYGLHGFEQHPDDQVTSAALSFGPLDDTATVQCTLSRSNK